MKRVALLIETANQSGRDILMGVGTYAAERGHWDLFHHPGELGSPWQDWLAEWKGDGVICRLHGTEMVPFLKELAIPVVDTFHNFDAEVEDGFPYVHVSEEEIGEMGAIHLIERNFRNFGFVSLIGESFPKRRFSGFRKALVERGMPEPECIEVERNEFGGNSGKLSQWLEMLPRPLGVMICSDIVALEVYTACRSSGLAIPSEVALVSVDNDEVQTQLVRPPLSSIDANHERVGYEAARMLDRMLDGDSVQGGVEISPLRVRVRGSSDTLATDDPVLARAIGYIQEHACEGIGNDDVAKAAGISRSVLQRRLREGIGKSVNRLITEERLARARRLLEDTDVSFIEVAGICGYDSQQSLNRACAREWEMTPTAIRRESNVMQ